jgi:hypothetical protein
LRQQEEEERLVVGSEVLVLAVSQEQEAVV